MAQIILEPIGIINTPFRQKFAIPRQPNLVDAKGTIQMGESFTDASCFKGLEQYSHLWLVFQFSETANAGWKNTVKAPRLGGDKTLGVFASRSTFRPNAMGLSVVKNCGYHQSEGRLSLDVSGVDLLSGTPILDIKPYLPYADSIEQSYAHINRKPIEPPQLKPVILTKTAKEALNEFVDTYPDLPVLTEQILAQDPRPAYKQKLTEDPKQYRVQVYDIDIHWRVVNDQIHIEGFTSLVSP
jgi:tRNA-Thr(GGU) m(6)t(6)A37 methyltransferase TsaA